MTKTKTRDLSDRVTDAVSRLNAVDGLERARRELIAAQAYKATADGALEAARQRQLDLARRLGPGADGAEIRQARAAVATAADRVAESEAVLAAARSSLDAAEAALAATDTDAVGAVADVRSSVLDAAAEMDAAADELVDSISRYLEAVEAAAPLNGVPGAWLPPLGRLRATDWMPHWLRGLAWRVGERRAVRWGIGHVSHRWREVRVEEFLRRSWRVPATDDSSSEG